MKKSTALIGLIAALAIPVAAEAKTLTLQTSMKRYGGEGAYLAIYVTDAQGKVHSTLHLAGERSKYRKYLRGWMRADRALRRQIDGITGASVGSGRTLKVSVDVADALIDAGYQIRIDSSVEDGRDVPADVVIPLEHTAAGKTVSGKGYVKTFAFGM